MQFLIVIGTARASLYVLHPDKVVEAESMPLEDALSALAAVSTKCRDAYVEIGAGQWGFRIVSKSFTKSRRHAKDLLPRSPPGHGECKDEPSRFTSAHD